MKNISVWSSVVDSRTQHLKTIILIPKQFFRMTKLQPEILEAENQSMKSAICEFNA